MATNAPGDRQTHVTRIFGTNRDGELLDNIWVDVERMDIVKSAMQVPPDMQWQGVQRRFRWCDDPSAGSYSPDGTPSRNLKILKVCDPQSQDVNDPDEWIPVKVIKSMRARVETGTAANGGAAMDRFLDFVTNEELRSARVVEARRNVHYDTNIDDDAQAAADAGLLEYVVPGDDYQKIESGRDDEQYIEHEVIKYLKHKGNAGDVSGIGRQTKLLNQYLIDESDDATLEITGPGGFNPPYRLDPYQNIVNVQFTSSVIVVLVFDASDTSSVVINNRAKFLQDFVAGAEFFQCRAYKASANAGECLQAKPLYTIVFAMDGDLAASLARAIDGAERVINAAEFGIIDVPPGPLDIDPPGVLWVVGVTFPTASAGMTWTLRIAKHRGDDLPANAMVQCYPNATPFVALSGDAVIATVSGYSVYVYRLDRKGTGASYGANFATATPGFRFSIFDRMDPAWLQTIIPDFGPTLGIPFGPPPLVSVDNISIGT